jgi:hypothetical protein
MAALTFSNLPIVVKIETLLACVYTYFNHSSKRNLEISKLVEVMETKGLKTRWINMVAPSKVVLEEFKTLLVRMVEDAIINEFVVANYELLCDIEILMGLTCLLPMLEALQGLNKYAQNKKTFIYDFMVSVKLGQVDLHNMYYNEEKKYNYSDFPQFRNFINHTSDPLHIVWWNNQIVGVQATFSYYGRLYIIHKTCKLTSFRSMVIQEAWAQSM